MMKKLPWIVYGQTQINNGQSLINPEPNVAGLEGEVAALPFTVPPGCRLHVTSYGIEGIGANTGGSNIVPFLGGGTAAANPDCLPSCQAYQRTNMIAGVDFVVPPSGKLGVILATNGVSAVYGWFIAGHIESDSEAA